MVLKKKTKLVFLPPFIPSSLPLQQNDALHGPCAVQVLFYAQLAPYNQHDLLPTLLFHALLIAGACSCLHFSTPIRNANTSNQLAGVAAIGICQSQAARRSLGKVSCDQESFFRVALVQINMPRNWLRSAQATLVAGVPGQAHWFGHSGNS